MSENCNHDCSNCGEDCPSRNGEKPDFSAPANAGSHVKKVIGVVSGKGGVGKSLVTSLMSALMRRRGHAVAILDADITGPSIPKALGVHGQLFGDDEGLIPAVSATGIELVSLNLLLPNETDPVVWRGLILGGTVKQFWSDVKWGDVDFMFVDMPPGTGDVPLTVFQSLPLNGILIVTSPQELVGMIVEKAANMARMMKRHYALIREFADRFKRKNACINCRELLTLAGLNPESGGEPEQRSKEFYQKRPCPHLVYDAALILDEMLQSGLSAGNDI